METQHETLPFHDFENDSTISDRRKDACKMAYQDMRLEHIDKIYTSAFVYDKKTGLPIAKKPRSLHELVWCMFQSQMAMSQKMLEMEHQINSITKLLELYDMELDNRITQKYPELLSKLKGSVK